MNSKKFDKSQIEMIISPTDILGNELEEILGGMANTDCFTCSDKFKCVVFTIGSPCGGNKPAQTQADCPNGYTLIDNYCIPNEFLGL
ncbi:MAG: hypothetical protein IKK23_01570 [Bacteroidales bacterium]|nr:hypothetical protein [Bacteroidales bacterium]MBR4094082.1 hypothetical protein [Bacteroidales bacterium]